MIKNGIKNKKLKKQIKSIVFLLKCGYTITRGEKIC